MSNIVPLYQQAITSIKAWGSEICLVNNDKYCGKILNFNKGSKFSMHYHMKKHETWYVLEGKFIFKWIDTTCADIQEKTIISTDVLVIPPGLPHQLIALENSKIIEISTMHEDNDSYRIMKGDNQLDK